jgi:organic radical activating enzyme
MIQENYCRDIFKNLYIVTEPDNQVRISSCCINKTGPLTSVIDFHDDLYLQEQRQQFQQGLKPEGCDLCWKKEKAGLTSRRMDQGAYRASDGDPYSTQMFNLTYHVSPLCNAKCITCNSSASSSWAAEDAKFGEVKINVRSFNQIRHTDIDLFSIDFRDLQSIYFNGGEPFLSQDINKVLACVKEQQGTLDRLSLNISTNASIMPSAEDVVLWNECKDINLYCSLEAVGPAFEYIRHPLDWNEVSYNVQNFHYIFPKLTKIMIAPNVGIHNALEYPDLVNWFEKLDKNVNYEIKPSLTYGPLGFAYASESVKEALCSNLGSDTRYQTICNYIQSSNKGGTDRVWQQHLDWIDQRRDLNWRQSLNKLATAISVV